MNRYFIIFWNSYSTQGMGSGYTTTITDDGKFVNKNSIMERILEVFKEQNGHDGQIILTNILELSYEDWLDFEED